MKISILTLAAACLMGSVSQAAVSPYYDSARKIQVALASSELANAMGQAAIESLSIVGDGTSVVLHANGCGYAVHLEAIPPQGIGATSYSVRSVVGPMCTGAK